MRSGRAVCIGVAWRVRARPGAGSLLPFSVHRRSAPGAARRPAFEVPVLPPDRRPAFVTRRASRPRKVLRYALFSGDRLLLLDAAPWAGGRPIGVELPAADATFLAPCTPTKIVCIGVNYADHAKESVSRTTVPDEPVLFLKPPSSRHRPGRAHRAARRASGAWTTRPSWRWSSAGATYRADREARARRDRRRDRGQRRLGPRPAEEGRPVHARQGLRHVLPHADRGSRSGSIRRDLAVRARVGGELRQDGRSRDLVCGPIDLVVYISNVMTLEPGDVISTGTPAGVSPIGAGRRGHDRDRGRRRAGQPGHRPRVSAGLLVRDARAWTGDPARPDASACFVLDGRFVAVGDAAVAEAAARAAAARGAEVATVSAAGRRLTPGLVDAHVHVGLAAERALTLELDREVARGHRAGAHRGRARGAAAGRLARGRRAGRRGLATAGRSRRARPRGRRSARVSLHPRRARSVGLVGGAGAGRRDARDAGSARRPHRPRRRRRARRPPVRERDGARPRPHSAAGSRAAGRRRARRAHARRGAAVSRSSTTSRPARAGTCSPACAPGAGCRCASRSGS